MRQRIVHAFVVIGLISTLSVLPCLGQVENASLTGLVTDPSGAVIAGATVAVKNTATNSSYTQQTDVTGYYFFPSLPIGSYRISVEMPGFKKAIQEGVTLQTGQRG